MARRGVSALTDEARATALRAAQMGLGKGTIAGLVGVARSTLYKWLDDDPEFGRDFDKAVSDGKVGVTAELLRQVKGGSTGATIFWLKQRAREEFGDPDAQKSGDAPAKVVLEITDRRADLRDAASGDDAGEPDAG